MLQDCNLVAYNGGGTQAQNAVFASGTSGLGNPPPCRLLVSSANGGYFAVLDSANHVLYIRPTSAAASTAPPATTLSPKASTPPPTSSTPYPGTLLSGQSLAQVTLPCTYI